MLREHIVEEALSWEGTPYHHLQRCKGVGVDCIQFPTGIALNLGLLTEVDAKRIPYYTSQWHLHRNEDLLITTLTQIFYLQEVSRDMCQPGDLLIFKFGKRVCNHAAIFLPDNQIIHATSAKSLRRVVRHSFDGRFHQRLQHCYRMPGITS